MICHFLASHRAALSGQWNVSNKEIAERFVGNKTISAHKANIFSKLGLHSIVEEAYRLRQNHTNYY